MLRWPEVALLLIVLVAIALALPDQGLWSDNSRGGGPPSLHKRQETDRNGASRAPRWVPAFPAKSQRGTTIPT